MNFVTRQTACGTLRGLETERCLEFRGIRYATAQRFCYPKRVTHWEGEYDATEFGACCYQHRAFDDDAVINSFYHKEFRKGLSFTYSEDCLFLNIWTPKEAENCPVILYIHGGSFTGGSGNEGQISGARFAESGVILVAINYRLGPFGFCSHPDVRGEDGACGNQGLFDQAEAILWVKENIAAFGGDPDRITLMGQSAGAMSVDAQLSNSKCRGAFSGAVLMSGAGCQRLVAKPLMPEKTAPFWRAVMDNAGVQSMEALKQTDAKTLYYAWLKAYRSMKLGMLYSFPVYDGVLLKKGEYGLGTVPDIPHIIGVTSTDMIPFVLQSITKKWAKYIEKNHTSKCYVYNFARALPGDDRGAWHACDLLYAFSTLDLNWRPFEPIDYALAEQLSASLCAFAKNRNPNCGEIPVWTAGGEKPLCFCETTRPLKWDTISNIRENLSGVGLP